MDVDMNGGGKPNCLTILALEKELGTIVTIYKLSRSLNFQLEKKSNKLQDNEKCAAEISWFDLHRIVQSET